jgi:hypothetical protein
MEMHDGRCTGTIGVFFITYTKCFFFLISCLLLLLYPGWTTENKLEYRRQKDDENHKRTTHTKIGRLKQKLDDLHKKNRPAQKEDDIHQEWATYTKKGRRTPKKGLRDVDNDMLTIRILFFHFELCLSFSYCFFFHFFYLLSD